MSLKKQKKNFNLLELIIVIIIIGIILTFAMPSFYNALQRGRDKEADAMLRLIQQAEHMYKLEVGGFTKCPKSGKSCNELLRLSLPTGIWEYKVPKEDNPNNNFCAQAKRGSKYWHIEADDEKAVSGKCN